MSTPGSDVLPESVRAEVDKIRKDAAEDEPQPLEQDEVAPVKLSRRAQKEQERQEELSASKARADAAEKIAEELRRQNETIGQRLSGIEQAFGELGQRATQAMQPAPKEPKPGDSEEKYARQMKKAKEALEAGDLDEYHRRLSRAMEKRIARSIPQPQPQPQPQQQVQQPMFQKPAWVTAVEGQFPDVIKHERGFATVAAFAQLDNSQLGPDKLERAFNRAREELGLSKRQNERREVQRQMLSGGPSNGSSGGNSRGGSTVNIKLAKGLNHKEIAKRAGMSEADYAKAYARMNPGDVEKD